MKRAGRIKFIITKKVDILEERFLSAGSGRLNDTNQYKFKIYKRSMTNECDH